MAIKINSHKGVSLIELVVSIVVLAIASVGIFSALGTIVGRSADPLIREQSIAIAEAYLEEITLSQFATLGACPAVPPPGGRANYSHVCHYNGLADTGARDQNNNPIAGLGAFNVSVAVTASGALNGIAASEVLRIDVTVLGPTNEPFSLSGYRTNY
jgi:MSHA pilin protein MshD